MHLQNDNNISNDRPSGLRRFRHPSIFVSQSFSSLFLSGTSTFFFLFYKLDFHVMSIKLHASSNKNIIQRHERAAEVYKNLLKKYMYLVIFLYVL